MYTMVSSSRTATRLMIILRPNQPASRSANVLVLLVVAIPLLTVATAFALLGAWLILPFAGAELLALGTALYYTRQKQQYRQVITVSDDSVMIDKGRHAPGERWHFPRHSTGLTITREQHPWEGPALRVHDRNDSVTLGEFLNREDSLQLIELLGREIRVRSRSARITREF